MVLFLKPVEIYSWNKVSIKLINSQAQRIWPVITALDNIREPSDDPVDQLGIQQIFLDTVSTEHEVMLNSLPRRELNTLNY